MKRKYVQAGFFAFLFMIFMVSTASAANFEPDDWSKSGQGTTTVETTADGGLKFTYNLNSSSIFQGQWWNFQSTAASNETFTFDWTYYAFHSWYQAQARAYAYADGPNGRQTVTLYNGYGQITTSGTTSLTLTEGYTYGFQIYGYNYDGTRVAQGNLTISGVDDVAPTTSLSTDPSGLSWFNSDVQVSLSAADSQSAIANTYYTVNGGAPQTGTTFAVTTEGENQISYWSVDAAGNVEAAKSATVKVDKTAPVTVDDAPASWQAGDVVVTLSASDGGSGVGTTYYQVNGGDVQSGNRVAITEEGTHTVTYWSVDAVGNVETAKSATVKVDKTAPVTSDDAPASWQAEDVVVTLGSSDGGSGVSATYYQINGGDVQSGNTVAITEEGTHTLKYWSVDAVGNVEVAKSATVKVDKTAPVTVDDAPATWQAGVVLVTLGTSDVGSGVRATYYQVNGGDVQSGNSVTISAEGTHTLTYWSVDAVGNVEASHSKTIRIDKTAPQLQVTLDQTSLWSPNHKLVQINATILSTDSNLESVVLTSITSNEADEGLGDGDLAQDIQGAAYGTFDTNFLLRSERAGNGSGRIYTITYTATDKAGNQTVYVVTVEVPHDKGNKKGKGK